MSDQITTTGAGNNATFNVHYMADNRQKRIEWVSGSCTVNKLYSALQNLFDELPQMDDGTVMSAQTPTEYTIGIIDAGARDPWFIDRTTVEKLTGGAIKTASWARVVGTNTGIVRMGYTETVALDPTDIGRTIRMTVDGDEGTLLDYNSVLTPRVVWIRPNNSAAGNSFDNVPTAGGAWTLLNEGLGQAWQVVAAGPTHADETTDANSPADADWQIFPATEAVGDHTMIGFRQRFRRVLFDNASAGATRGIGGAVVWEYWNGTAWTALSGVSDGTSGFTAAKSDGQVLTFTVPTDWAATSINGSAVLFYIRARITTAYSTNPVYDQGFIGATGTGSQTGGTAVTGESLWANIYTLGTIERFTHIYVNQNAAYLTAYKSTTTDWWGDDHIDILVNVREVGAETDEGQITVYARQYSKTYSFFIVGLTAGGRNPIPLQTGRDLDNQNGFRQFTGTGGVGTFDVGNYLYWTNSGAFTWATSTKRAVITKVAGTTTAPIVDYYLIGHPILDFSANDAVIREYTGTADGDASCNVSAAAPINVGPAALAIPPEINFNNFPDGGAYDINEDGVPENYSIAINCNNHSLAVVYEWTKFVTRRGSTGDINSTTPPVITGQFYLGSDTRIIYNTLTGSIGQGDVLTQITSGFRGTVVNHNTTDKIIILRNSRGTFNQTNDVRKDGTNFVTLTGSAPIASITPIAAAPFGTFAGGKFFCAPGIVLFNYLTADSNNFQLVDDNGIVRVAPTKVNVTVGNTRAGDKVAVFRLTAGGMIQKDRYAASTQAIGATTLVISTAGGITADEPGKTTGGVVRLVDVSASREYRIRFSNWASSTFTLASRTGLVAEGTSGTVLNDAQGTFQTWGIQVGDIIRNITESRIAYVISVDSETSLTTTAVTNWTGDSYEINTLPVATTTADTVYVPFIDVHETMGTDGSPGSETVQVVFSTAISARARARNAGVILPFEQDASIGSGGMSVSVIRTPDTIFTP